MAAKPETGDVMEVSGGVRVIYFFHTENAPLYVLMIYAKNEKADVTGKDRKAMRAVEEAIKASWKDRR